MLQMIPLDDDQVIGIRIDGKVRSEEFRPVASAIEEKIRQHGKVRVYAEVPSFGGMSMEAFLKDMKVGLRNWRRFEREAIVTDKGWLRHGARIASKVVPSTEVRVFRTADQEAARQWVSERRP